MYHFWYARASCFRRARGFQDILENREMSLFSNREMSLFSPYFLLTGYYKLYAFRKSIRVVCLIIDDEVVVKDVGRREDFEVYAEVARRLLKK